MMATHAANERMFSIDSHEQQKSKFKDFVGEQHAPFQQCSEKKSLTKRFHIFTVVYSVF